MPFLNRIRLPLYLKQAQFPTEANRFRKADGSTKTLSVTIRKTYLLVTDWMNEAMHQRLVIALNHDTVNVEGDRYGGGISMDGEYEPQWIDFMDYPIAPAQVRVQVTPFNFTNDNCQTCEEATQMELEDDDFGTINEGDEASVNAFANDSICCSPITAEIMSFNTSYLDSATIEDGVITVQVKNPVASVTDVLLVTYRVTCPNGDYDEADVYGTIVGSEIECQTPTPDAITFDGNDVTINWAPLSGDMEWQLYLCSDLGTPINSGTVTGEEVEIEGLDSGQCYVFTVRQDCGGGNFSEWASSEFTVPLGSDACGRFLISANDGTTDPTVYNYSYMNCAGTIVNRPIANLSSQRICMLTDDANIPTYFVPLGPIVYSYEIPCPIEG